ncbi:MAG: MBL fold metallo-hydrolase [Oscillospiraceae bacterium]|nr:MBL fold metallo-hydrolase [Oscillospiraceae bacterium]
MTEKIFDNVYRIDVPLPNNPLKNLNSYVILGERSLIIDTGFNLPECRAALTSGLAELKVDMDRADIFLTHLHADHAGLASLIRGKDTRIFISEEDRGRLISFLSPEPWNRAFDTYVKEGFPAEELEEMWMGNPARAFAAPPYYDYVAVDDGEELNYGGHSLRCVLTPGHTPGHMCLYMPEKKAMFLGDHVLFKITPNITRWEDAPDSLGDYLRSLGAIEKYEIDIPLPAHRQVLCTLGERVEQLKAHHEKRIAEALAAVRENPGITAYDVAGKMNWDIRCRSWEDFPLTQKWFAVGEAMSHLDWLVAHGMAERVFDGTFYRYAAI